MFDTQITMKDIPASEALHSHILDKADKLNQYSDRIGSCRVVIELEQKHKRQGKLFSVHIDLRVPGKELVANHNSDEDVYVAVRDAFHAIERQIEKYNQIRKGHVKQHVIPFSGHVTKIFEKDGFGFIRGIDEVEYYFNEKNVVHPNFEKLNIGDFVTFTEFIGSEGEQAHNVIVKKPDSKQIKINNIE